MGGAVKDRQRREELEGLHGLSDLAGDLVHALGTFPRREDLSPAEEEAVAKARALFELMTSHDVIAVGTSAGRFGGERSYLDAVRAVEREASGRGIEEQARGYAETLEKVLEEDLPEPERIELEPKLVSLRRFFIRMSESVLARTDELSRARQESPWRAPQTTSIS